MPVNLRRISRAAKPPAPVPAVDPRLGRAIRHLISAERSRVLPSDRELDRLAEVQPADIDRAEALWDLAQQQAGTGLDGLLSAATEDDG
jgi:hypothetical protein